MRLFAVFFLLLVFIFHVGGGVELTFELPDNANQCFYEDIKEGVQFVVEFQVVTGGQYDVDVVLEGPNGETIYKEVRKQMDSQSVKSRVTGTYKLCFSNEFSTFSHKIVYMDWNVPDTNAGSPQARPPPRTAASSGLENRISAIANRLRIIDDYQTHHRLREATGRKNAEDLNERVLYWSLGQTAVIVIVAIGQVLLLRSFFSDRSPHSYRRLNYQ